VPKERFVLVPEGSRTGDPSPRRRRRILYQRINDSLLGLAMPIANTEIPLTADFQTAPAEGQTLFSWRQDSLGALAYRRLALELAVPGSTDGSLRSAPVWA
jgi:cellulose biosynthesis protein BcsQ